MSHDLNINWDEFLDEDDVNTMWEKFDNKLQEAITKHIPQVKFSGKKYKFPLDKQTRSKINSKNRLWKKYITSQDQQSYTDYCKTRNQVRRLTRKAQKIYEKEIAKDAKCNPKKFWNYVSSKSKYKPGIPDLRNNTTNK